VLVAARRPWRPTPCQLGARGAATRVRHGSWGPQRRGTARMPSRSTSLPAVHGPALPVRTQVAPQMLSQIRTQHREACRQRGGGRAAPRGAEAAIACCNSTCGVCTPEMGRPHMYCAPGDAHCHVSMRRGSHQYETAALCPCRQSNRTPTHTQSAGLPRYGARAPRAAAQGHAYRGMRAPGALRGSGPKQGSRRGAASSGCVLRSHIYACHFYACLPYLALSWRPQVRGRCRAGQGFRVAAGMGRAADGRRRGERGVLRVRGLLRAGSAAAAAAAAGRAGDQRGRAAEAAGRAVAAQRDAAQARVALRARARACVSSPGALR